MRAHTGRAQGNMKLSAMEMLSHGFDQANKEKKAVSQNPRLRNEASEQCCGANAKNLMSNHLLACMRSTRNTVTFTMHETLHFATMHAANDNGLSRLISNEFKFRFIPNEKRGGTRISADIP